MSTTGRAPSGASVTDDHGAPADAATRVLWVSTLGCTLMFAVWLMFGILGKPTSTEFGLSEVQLSWVIVVAVLNGSMWRLPVGMLTDPTSDTAPARTGGDGVDRTLQEAR